MDRKVRHGPRSATPPTKPYEIRQAFQGQSADGRGPFGRRRCWHPAEYPKHGICWWFSWYNCEAILTYNKIMGVAGMPHWLPDLQIASATSPSGYRIIPRCKGPQILVQKMMAEDPRVRPAHLSLWSVVRLFRNGADLGSLARIRDDYTFWQDRLDEWARLNGQPRRARRCLVRSGLRWYNGAFHRVLPDGSLMKLDDQYQHNPTQSAAF